MARSLKVQSFKNEVLLESCLICSMGSVEEICNVLSSQINSLYDSDHLMKLDVLVIPGNSLYNSAHLMKSDVSGCKVKKQTVYRKTRKQLIPFSGLYLANNGSKNERTHVKVTTHRKTVK